MKLKTLNQLKPYLNQILTFSKQSLECELGGLIAGSSVYLVSQLLAQKPTNSHLLLFATEEETERAFYQYQIFQEKASLSLFPFWESNPFDDTLFSEALALLKQLSKKPTILFCSLQALLQQVPSPEVLKTEELQLKKGEEYTRETLLEKLSSAGFVRTAMVGEPGEFSVRGSILDIFSFAEENPFRLEFFGDELEDIRLFHVENQRSIEHRKQIKLSLVHYKKVQEDETYYSVLDYLKKDSFLAFFDPNRIEERASFFIRDLRIEGFYLTLKNRFKSFQSLKLYPLPVAQGECCFNFEVDTLELPQKTTEHTVAFLKEAIAEEKDIHIVCQNKLEIRKFQEYLQQNHLTASIKLYQGSLGAGFHFKEFDLIYGSYFDFFLRPQLPQPTKPRPKKFKHSAPIQDFIDLKSGDYIVHLSHGIGQFLGIRSEYREGLLQDFIYLRFANDVELKLPATSLALIQKYVHVGSKSPKLDIVGSKTFQKRIEKVRFGVMDIASELLELQAIRDKSVGIAFPEDTEWQQDFDDAFPFELTVDQVEAEKRIKEDMESSRPMDRLLCGDVGFGKTELAIRAAFKAVNYNKQVAFLAPTTVLAKQHYLTIQERMIDFPIEVAYVSKYLSPKEQKKVIEKAKEGKIDILIGTHRLLSKDVAFRDLGLLVIDEEQRFGVEHKERLKKMRATVDILTLTATPIPRTLNLSLIGLRDISVLTTPPKDRYPVITRVVPWESDFIRQAILEEIYREGQVYFVHNRVQPIEQVQQLLAGLIPEVTFDIIHGQLPPKTVEARMTKFLKRETQVLVCTSIIEFGLDIPNVNTIIVNQAEKFGISDLHQLRGRVGRYHHQAYAYFVVSEHKILGAAKKRLKAIEEFSHLGAGFQLSMKDLEIRGSGNLMGYEQSGHIASIGYELYCQILKETVSLLKQQPYHYRIHPNIKVNLETRIPEEYIPDANERMGVYRKLSAVLTQEEYDALEQECLDRFGPFPPPFKNILLLTRLRAHAEEFSLPEIQDRGRHFLIRYYDLTRLKMALTKNATIRYPEENYAVCFIREDLPVMEHLLQLFNFQ